jgi:CubicO group peptidase (beta-lactamase class C family)
MAAAIILLVSISAAVAAPADDAWKSADVYLRHEMRERNIQGMAVAVIQHGKVSKLATYGQASVEFGIPVRASTPFSVASISKSFTAVAVMMLVEAGKLQLQDPISSYLNDLPAAWQGVTVRQLLNHTSGLPDITVNDYSTATIAETYTDAIRAVGDRPLDFPPGSDYRYNQTNYMVLGMLIARLSGKSYEEFCAQRLFMPLKLQAASFGDARAVVTQRATTYTPFRFGGPRPIRMDRIEVLNAEMPAMIHAAGGLNISIADFAAWLAALTDGKLIADSSLKVLWTPATLTGGAMFQRPPTSSLWRAYGLGWVLGLEDPHPFAGGSGGIRSAFFVYPKDDLAVIVLTNTQGAGPESLVQGVAEKYFVMSD